VERNTREILKLGAKIRKKDTKLRALASQFPSLKNKIIDAPLCTKTLL